MKHLVVYHNSCMDGFVSAWIVFHSLTRRGIPEEDIEFLGADYGDPIPDMTGKNVFIVDFSWYDVEGLLKQVEKAVEVKMLDHHKEAHKVWKDVKLPANMIYKHELPQSGVGVVWDHFHPHTHAQMPPLLAHIQDRDLWKFNIQGSRQIHAFLKSKGFLLRDSNRETFLAKLKEFGANYAWLSIDALQPLYTIGQAIMDAETILVCSILERNKTYAEFIHYGLKDDDSGDMEPKKRYFVPVGEMPHELADEAGDIMGHDDPFAITYETNWALGKRRFSIRSRKGYGRSADVGEIARAMGGGGHQHAAGWYDSIWMGFPFQIKR